MAMNRFTLTIFNLKSDLAQYEETLAKFKANLNQDPAYALRWADAAFDAVPAIEEFSRVLHDLEAGVPMEKVAEAIAEDLLNCTTNPATGSSQATNLVSVGRTKALARLSRALRSALRD